MVYMPIKRLSYTKKRNIRKRTIKTRKRRMHKKMQGGSNTKIKLFNWGGSTVTNSFRQVYYTFSKTSKRLR